MLIDDRMQNLAKLLDVASLRARVHAANIANQNTPGYRSKAVEFDGAFRDAMDHSSAAARAIDPQVVEPRSTPVSNDGNDVAVDREVSEMAKNQMLYNAYLSLMRGKGRMLDTAIRESP